MFNINNVSADTIEPLARAEAGSFEHGKLCAQAMLEGETSKELQPGKLALYVGKIKVRIVRIRSNGVWVTMTGGFMSKEDQVLQRVSAKDLVMM